MYTFTRDGQQIEDLHNTVDNLPNIISNKNLISNSDFSIPGSVANHPDSTPRSYSAGDELFAGFIAVNNLSGVTYVDGKINGSGQLYVDIYKTEKQKLSTITRVASIASSDGVAFESGASLVDNGDYWRVTFDMNNTFSVKLERGSVPTVHDNNLSSLGSYTFNNVNEVKSSSAPVGSKINWLGYNEASDGGSNWGVVKKGAHTEDGFEIFSLGTETYVKANIVGTNNPMMAGLFGGNTDVAKIQNLIDKSTGRVKFGHEQDYNFDAGWFINGNGKELDLNGSTMNFTTETFSIYDKGNNNSVVNGVIITDYTLGSGGNGHAGSCITVGEQSTGNGQYGFEYKKLELTTNRTDAGAHISVIGGCYNGTITKIKIRDNAVCRNLIGIEWGGTPANGTQHPHDISVSKINVGKITTPTFGVTGYAFVVWCSSAFNISVSSIDCEEAYGLMMCIAGDNSNTYAPDEYKDLVGTGISLKNAGILACYGYALRAVGKGGNTPDQIPCNLKAKGIRAVGKKVGANNNFGLQAEFCDGVHLEDFAFTGVWAAGTTLGSDAKNVNIENGEVTGCELYGSSVGSGAVKSIKPTIRRVNYYNNNTLGGLGSGTSAVAVYASDDAVVEFCNFGKEGETETQRYSVYTDSSANRPKVMHNHTYVNDNPAINPYLNGSATVYDENNTKDF